MKKTISMIVFIAALIFTIGSVGALECDNISALQCIVQCVIGIIAGLASLKYMEVLGQI